MCLHVNHYPTRSVGYSTTLEQELTHTHLLINYLLVVTNVVILMIFLKYITPKVLAEPLFYF